MAGVIGDPVRHSLSPVIHNAAFSAGGIDWVYVAFAVPAGRACDALAAMRILDIAGLSVTMPHKAGVLAGLDEVSDEASALGAANTVYRRGSRLIGDNTDGYGFIRALREEQGLEVEGLRCVVVGAGGAARAVVYGLHRHGAGQVIVVNRTPARATEAAALGGAVGRVGEQGDIAHADLVVNATPVGMGVGSGAEYPFDPQLLGPGQVLVDLVYQPPETPLLAIAAARGARVMNGLSMLLYQAARQFELWTGQSAPLAAMRSAVRISPPENPQAH